MSTARWNLKEAGGKVPARGTRTLSGRSCVDELANQSEVPRLHGHNTVNGAGRWNESLVPYHGRSHGRADVFFSEARCKACREKSAEAIVQRNDVRWKG